METEGYDDTWGLRDQHYLASDALRTAVTVLPGQSVEEILEAAKQFAMFLHPASIITMNEEK